MPRPARVFTIALFHWLLTDFFYSLFGIILASIIILLFSIKEGNIVVASRIGVLIVSVLNPVLIWIFCKLSARYLSIRYIVIDSNTVVLISTILFAIVKITLNYDPETRSQDAIITTLTYAGVVVNVLVFYLTSKGNFTTNVSYGAGK